MRLLRFCFAFAALAFAAPVAAQGGSALETARQAGAVGERWDGYLGLARQSRDEVRRQVGAVNIRRRSLYTGLSGRRNVTLQAVGIAAGCELLARVGPGESYMLQDNVWRRRNSGEPPPVPDYCAK